MALDVDMEPPPIKPSEDAMFVTDDALQAETEPDEIAAEDVETDIIAEMPEESDEATRWLEQLAARQGAALEELPTVTDADAEPSMPDWMSVDLEDEIDEETEAVDDTAVTSGLSEEAIALDEDVDAEMPDWLDSDDDSGSGFGQTGWLTNLPEVDVETWLSAEEEATTAGPVEEPAVPDTGPLRSQPVIEPDPEPVDDLFEPVLEPTTGAYSVDEARLEVAQKALSDGRVNEAISQFKGLVAEGAGMMTIIAELEQAADAHPKAPALYQVLGDAYMRNGQLQKALASYRTALDQM